MALLLEADNHSSKNGTVISGIPCVAAKLHRWVPLGTVVAQMTLLLLRHVAYLHCAVEQMFQWQMETPSSRHCCSQ